MNYFFTPRIERLAFEESPDFEDFFMEDFFFLLFVMPLYITPPIVVAHGRL